MPPFRWIVVLVNLVGVFLTTLTDRLTVLDSHCPETGLSVSTLPSRKVVEWTNHTSAALWDTALLMLPEGLESPARQTLAGLCSSTFVAMVKTANLVNGNDSPSFG